MNTPIQALEETFKKKAVVDVRSGDTVRVHQKIKEGGKERVQVFEGLAIKTSKPKSLTAHFTVRRIASGVGVEKSFLIHSPSVLKVEVVKRSKVRRNYLSYMRALTGKSARLSGVEFDKEAVNTIQDEAAEAEEAKIHEQKAELHEAAEAEREAAKEEQEAKVEEALAGREDKSEVEKTEAQPKEKTGAKAPAAEQPKTK